jgi:hypothetical protein
MTQESYKIVASLSTVLNCHKLSEGLVSIVISYALCNNSTYYSPQTQVEVMFEVAALLLVRDNLSDYTPRLTFQIYMK